MLAAEQSLKDGDIQSAMAQLQEQVRSNPAKAELRVFLFQLLSVQGQWGRALTQLDVAGDLDAATLAMVQTYREALRCEALRAEVFAGVRSPVIFGDPEEWMALCIQALALGAKGNIKEAADLRNQAFESAPLTFGTIGEETFAWIADADSRIGPFIEAIVNGSYYWIPWQHVGRITMDEPEDLRDMVWTAAQFTWANGGQAVGLIPTRYPGSELSEDGKIKLARKTEWLDQGSDQFFGLGQRVITTDVADHALLDTREIVLNTTAEVTIDDLLEETDQGSQ